MAEHSFQQDFGVKDQDQFDRLVRMFNAERKATNEDGPGNPPAFAKGRKALWEKSKRAARKAKARDIFAFANWWFHNIGLRL